MTTWIHGFVKLKDYDTEAKERIWNYWKMVGEANGVAFSDKKVDTLSLLPFLPEDSVSFFINTQTGRGDGFLLTASQNAGYLLKTHPELSPLSVWPFVPQWHFLFTILNHANIVGSYLIVEDATGDAADHEDIVSTDLISALSTMWHNYVYNSSERCNNLRYFSIFYKEWKITMNSPLRFQVKELFRFSANRVVLVGTVVGEVREITAGIYELFVDGVAKASILVENEMIPVPHRASDIRSISTQDTDSFNGIDIDKHYLELVSTVPKKE